MNEQAGTVRTIAERHGLSEAAAETLFRALVSGGAGQAQFSHPDLGGLGQWSSGMTQLGDMFNEALKARVNAFCHDMAPAARLARSGGVVGAGQRQSQGILSGTPGMTFQGDPWWPSDLGSPASSGAQNDMRYAFFPDRRRLAVQRGGVVTLYDTGTHLLNGFSQRQNATGSLSFSGQRGAVALASLTIVDR